MPGFVEGAPRRRQCKVGRMERWRSALRQAVRTAGRHPLLAGAVVLTLGLGIGVNTMLFSVMHAVLLRPLPFRDPSRLLVVWEQDPTRDGHLHEVSFPDFRDWRAQTRSFADMAAMGSINWGSSLRHGGEKLGVSYRAVSASFFETLGVRPLLGRGLLPEDDEPRVEPRVPLPIKLQDPLELRYGCPSWRRSARRMSTRPW